MTRLIEFIDFATYRRLIAAIVVTCTLVLAPTLHSESLDGFWNIAWGTSLQNAQVTMLNKSGVTLNADLNAAITKAGLPSGVRIKMFQGPFAGLNAEITMAFLDSGGFFKAIVNYGDIKRHEVISTWKETRMKLTEKYGTPETDYFLFLKPYYEGDGFEKQAIQNGKGIALVAWVFSDGNSIMCKINDELKIQITYENASLTSAAAERMKSKQLNDL